MTKTTSFAWIFITAAVLILIFACDVHWAAAIGCSLLAACDFKVTTTTSRSRLPYRR